MSRDTPDTRCTHLLSQISQPPRSARVMPRPVLFATIRACRQTIWFFCLFLSKFQTKRTIEKYPSKSQYYRRIILCYFAYRPRRPNIHLCTNTYNSRLGLTFFFFLSLSLSHFFLHARAPHRVYIDCCANMKIWRFEDWANSSYWLSNIDIQTAMDTSILES